MTFLDSFSFQTRYRGSKVKLLPAIFDVVKKLEFNTVLDAFAGTGAVSYLFKRMDKKVLFNDHLQFNYIIGRALIENSEVTLSNTDLELILKSKPYGEHSHLIEENFPDIYYTKDENIWLDRVVSNLHELEPGFKRDMGFWCLFQSCILKRPFSLFHRKNLNLRMQDVKRSFGNKVTWDTPFEDHYRRFAQELNSYIISTKNPCFSSNCDVMEVRTDFFDEGFDLIYVDPPYIPKKGENIVYRDLYHFLEGMIQYQDWEPMIDFNSKHRRIKPVYNIWNDKKEAINAFKGLLHKFQNSSILLSHRSEGIPSMEELMELLGEYWNDVSIVDRIGHKYALSTRKSDEILILARM